ncbi:hypothetical protein BIZ36_20245 [Cytophaga sp. FL35]|nr:hypothetical protein [Cytophaga sp. FL35]
MAPKGDKVDGPSSYGQCNPTLPCDDARSLSAGIGAERQCSNLGSPLGELCIIGLG